MRRTFRPFILRVSYFRLFFSFNSLALFLGFDISAFSFAAFAAAFGFTVVLFAFFIV